MCLFEFIRVEGGRDVQRHCKVGASYKSLGTSALLLIYIYSKFLNGTSIRLSWLMRCVKTPCVEVRLQLGNENTETEPDKQRAATVGDTFLYKSGRVNINILFAAFVSNDCSTTTSWYSQSANRLTPVTFSVHFTHHLKLIKLSFQWLPNKLQVN
jgi:hypothetical protein